MLRAPSAPSFRLPSVSGLKEVRWAKPLILLSFSLYFFSFFNTDRGMRFSTRGHPNDAGHTKKKASERSLWRVDDLLRARGRRLAARMPHHASFKGRWGRQGKSRMTRVLKIRATSHH